MYEDIQVHSSHTLIIRFLAREIGIAGRDSLEMAQVDEIVDVIQDAINANVSDGDKIRMIVDDNVSLVQGVVRTQQTRGAHQGH